LSIKTTVTTNTEVSKISDGGATRALPRDWVAEELHRSRRNWVAEEYTNTQQLGHAPRGGPEIKFQTAWSGPLGSCPVISAHH